MPNQFTHPYTPEQKSWARNYGSTHTVKQTTVAFNEKFNEQRTESAIHHLIAGTKPDFFIHYTPEMLDFIREQTKIPNNSWKKIVINFNNHFHTNAKYFTIRKYANQFGIQTTSNHNDNFTFYPKPRYETGTEIIRTRENGEKYIVIKVNSEHKKHKTNWIRKHRYIWEQHYGKIPKNHSIIFLDGNPLNCDINNLRCVSNSVFKKIQGNRYTDSNYGLGEITDTLLTVFQVQEQLSKL